MAISVGETLPEATLLRIGPDGPEQVDLHKFAAGRKIVIFAVIGAFTGTCSNEHVPSFMRTRDQFAAKGVDEIVCLSVNDPFVMQAWGQSVGAEEAGVTLLADPESSFTKAIGIDFNVPPVGFIDRSKRYAMLVEDGKVTELLTDDDTRVFDRSSGEALLAAM